MLDLKTLQALNKFWQDKFDKRHPEAARRRDAKDRAAKAVRLHRLKPTPKRQPRTAA